MSDRTDVGMWVFPDVDMNLFQTATKIYKYFRYDADVYIQFYKDWWKAVMWLTVNDSTSEQTLTSHYLYQSWIEVFYLFRLLLWI